MTRSDALMYEAFVHLVFSVILMNLGVADQSNSFGIDIREIVPLNSYIRFVCDRPIIWILTPEVENAFR